MERVSETRLQVLAGMDGEEGIPRLIQGSEVYLLAVELVRARFVVGAARECLKFHSSTATHTKNSWGVLKESLRLYDGQKGGG